ncbi:cytochrome P450 17A1 [Pseudozyma hubeiensis SY62]|uniref:Cytochrome P450 17A1 n=1 Tax=Pseudozyma hubeiensis (strain SY62) TaxID=1305764 RepID=R9PIW0_PSEHS|nr:cytochrome P450 17A1 [Pseudozyma hubeiensis SY62]GAC98055.1 cytochrome P450 17A1 [Pseudozyma hubeiensis SY62]
MTTGSLAVHYHSMQNYLLEDANVAVNLFIASDRLARSQARSDAQPQCTRSHDFCRNTIYCIQRTRNMSCFDCVSNQEESGTQKPRSNMDKDRRNSERKQALQFRTPPKTKAKSVGNVANFRFRKSNPQVKTRRFTSRLADARQLHHNSSALVLLFMCR